MLWIFTSINWAGILVFIGPDLVTYTISYKYEVWFKPHIVFYPIDSKAYASQYAAFARRT